MKEPNAHIAVPRPINRTPFFVRETLIDFSAVAIAMISFTEWGALQYRRLVNGQQPPIECRLSVD
jgi:hypothetical protein